MFDFGDDNQTSTNNTSDTLIWEIDWIYQNNSAQTKTKTKTAETQTENQEQNMDLTPIEHKVNASRINSSNRTQNNWFCYR